MIKFDLKKVMKQKGINISQLNEMTGISRNSLSLLINGKSQGVQFETIEKITRALNIEVAELFKRSFNELKIELGSLYNITQSHKYQQGNVHPETKEFTPTGAEEEQTYTFIGIGSKYIIDGNELEETIPYNFSVEFNTEDLLYLNIVLKDSDFKNDFIYLLDNVNNFNNLFTTYIALTILEHLKGNKLKKIKNNFNIINKTIKVTNDLSEKAIYLQLNDDLTVNHEHLNSEIKKTNDKTLYEITFDDGIHFKYQK